MSVDSLDTQIQFLKGVGPQRAELLERLDIRTVEALLWHIPRDVLDLTEVRDPIDLVEGELQTVRGSVCDLDARQLSRGRTLTACLLDCTTDYVRGTWFNQPWMIKRLQMGETVLFSGKPKRRQGRWEFSHPRIQWIDAEDAEADGGVIPRYRLTEGLTLQDLRRMIRNAVEATTDLIADPLPEAFRERQELVPLATALRHIHLPARLDDYEAGRRRLLFDDLFEFQLGLALRRRHWRTKADAPKLETTAKIDSRIRRLFPFRFTDGQNSAIQDIVADIRTGHPMHRLIQADVGAGKTAIAVYGMLVAVAAGYQTVLMAPTELLASQHWETIDRILSHSRVQRAYLTGSLTAAERRRVLEGIGAGDIQLVVGTQAVIQSDVTFPHLGLAVVDEQHKFGVAQRAGFQYGDQTPHVLVMTATPIPRSLCLTQFGDLDLTVVSDLPPGRQRVVTSRINGDGARAKAWDFIRRQLRQGRQAYVVCPRVDADSNSDAGGAGAIQTYQRLANGELADFRLGLVHGQMDRGERADIMDRFRDGELDVLVATTVIEVGVDVPNATLMAILDAERFGLSQLHQLRGRIARGRYQGYCFLDTNSTDDDAMERMTAMEREADGFAIAEKDFELRGPGDILGARQHGASALRIADLVRDAELLREARKAAFDLVESGEVDNPEYVPLKVRVLERFGEMLQLPQAG